MSQSVAKILVDYWVNSGVTHIFFVPSIQVDPLCIAVAQNDALIGITATDELSAAYMAEGYSRITGLHTVVLSGGSCAASYVIPSANNSRLENLPVLYVTGSNASHIEYESTFQSVGYEGGRDSLLFETAIGHSVTATSSDYLLDAIISCEQQLRCYQPAHMMIPVNVQSESLGPDSGALIFDRLNQTVSPKDHLNNEPSCRHIAMYWEQSSHPLLILGERLNQLHDFSLLSKLIERLAAPVLTTFGGLGMVLDNNPYYLGHFGLGGSEIALNAISSPDHDLIIYIGASLGEREEINHKLNTQRSIRIDTLKHVSKDKNYIDEEIQVSSFDDTLNQLMTRCAPKKKFCSGLNMTEVRRMEKRPCIFTKTLNTLQSVLPDEAIVYVDAGIHRKLTAKYWRITSVRNFQSSPKQAPMGWAIAASIGGQLAQYDAPVICVTGDGCMRAKGNEIAVAAKYQIPIIFLVVNNGRYGSVASRLKTNQEIKEIGHLPRLNWVNYAKSLGASGALLESLTKVKETVIEAQQTSGPYVIDLYLPEDYSS